MFTLLILTTLASAQEPPPAEAPAEEPAESPADELPAAIPAGTHLTPAEPVTARTVAAPSGPALAAFASKRVYRTQDQDWTLHEGHGRELEPLEFAQRVGDTAGAARIQGELQRAGRSSIPFLAAGGALIVAGQVSLVAPYVTANYDPEFLEMSALGWLGGTLGGAALAVVGGVNGLRWAQLKNQPRRSYSAEEAQRWIDEHNARIGEELGLTPEQRKAYE